MQFLKNSNTAKLWYTIALVIVLIPTYFIHTQKYPDWGDDFAQYVYQAQQIHTPSKVYKEVLNVEEYSSGKKRSVFFSVTMSFISPTIDIDVYVDYISLTYILAAVCFFIFLSYFFSHWISFLITLCVFYNFLFLRLKSEVVPEFLFIALSFFVFIFYHKLKKQKFVLIPLLIALLFSVRFLGLAMLFAYLISILNDKEKNIKQKSKELMITSFVFLVVIFFINFFFIAHVSNQEIKLYGAYLFENFRLDLFLNNCKIYMSYITLFFDQEIPFWINTIIKFSVCILFIIGFINSLKNRGGIVDYYFVIYFLCLFVYPVNNDTIRYLIPIMPLFFYYTLQGLLLSVKSFDNTWKYGAVLCSLIIVLLSNSKTIWLAINRVEENVGPYESSVLNDFEMIKKIVPDSKTIAFGKPFIVSLLMDRHSYFLSQTNYCDILNKADYALISKPNINELYPKTIGVKIAKGDTTELTNFYLVKL